MGVLQLWEGGWLSAGSHPLWLLEEGFAELQQSHAALKISVCSF